jgi:hypothetical protein
MGRTDYYGPDYGRQWRASGRPKGLSAGFRSNVNATFQRLYIEYPEARGPAELYTALQKRIQRLRALVVHFKRLIANQVQSGYLSARDLEDLSVFQSNLHDVQEAIQAMEADLRTLEVFAANPDLFEDDMNPAPRKRPRLQ